MFLLAVSDPPSPGPSDPKIEKLRALLRQVDLQGDDYLWDQEVLHAALRRSVIEGIRPRVILSCWISCKCQRPHTGRMSGTRRERKARILAVDDEESFTELVKLNLERTRRYEVVTQADPAAVIGDIGRHQPDLVLLDVVMPGTDGVELVKQIRAEPDLEQPPIIMITALLEGSESGGVTNDGYLYLSKPVGTQSLVYCIEQHLTGGRGEPI
ncbi:MAG TPA: response regulator [Verrucomicrobiales bacterium]|nr:response regulator [Verrucomicrobiales bacterium]